MRARAAGAGRGIKIDALASMLAEKRWGTKAENYLFPAILLAAVTFDVHASPPPNPTTSSTATLLKSSPNFAVNLMV